MKQEIIIPQMGESITEATIGNILKLSGSAVKIDEEILELETDKVNQAIYAPANGILMLNVKAQDVVKIGQSIGYIETEGLTAPEPQKEVKPAQEKSTRTGKDQFLSELKEEAPIKQEQSKPVSPPPPPPPAPLKEKPTQTSSEARSETRQKLPKIRQVIAQRLMEVQSQTAMLTTFNEVDLTQVIILKERYKDLFLKDYGVKLGYMSFFIKAVVSALEEFPIVQAYIDGSELVYRNYYDISIAVSTERGLVVPVIKNCNHLSFAEIEKTLEQLTVKARQGTIALDELKGGGFTITNGGVFGSLLSTPILNPPQAAILGMHKIQKRPVAVNDQVMIRPMMYLALTYDHRILDGRDAVTFLLHIKQCLEDPSRILLEV